MAVPTWQAPVAGKQALAGHVNQFLGTHPTVYLYQGALQASGSPAGDVAEVSYGGYLAQAFATGANQTAAGYAVLTMQAFGTIAVPWQLSLQADAGGQPSGTPLASAAVPAEFAPPPYERSVPVPLPAAVTPGTQYWIVAAPAGAVNECLSWVRSTATSGAQTSADGVTWTPQSWGLTFEVYDQSQAPPLAGTWEDSGARWTWNWHTGGLLTGTWEFTAGQTPGGYVAVSRSLSYSGPYLTGVT